jgi:hypothetical protein
MVFLIVVSLMALALLFYISWQLSRIAGELGRLSQLRVVERMQDDLVKRRTVLRQPE